MGIFKKAASTAKNITKKQQTAVVKSITKPLAKIPGAKNVAQKLEAEGIRGINKYSDPGQDIVANIASGGTYGRAMAADQAMENPQATIQQLTSPEALTGYAGSQLGIDPTRQALLSRLSTQGQLRDQFGNAINIPGLDEAMPKIGQKSLEDVNAIQKSNMDVSLLGPLGKTISQGFDKAKGWFKSEPEFGRGEVPSEEEEAAQGPSTLDKIKREGKRIAGQIKGAAGSVGDKIKETAKDVADYNAENPELANAAISTAAGALAFKQKQDALQDQQKILSEQLEQARRMQTFEQEQPESYKEMVKGGPTSKYAQEMLGTARDAGQFVQGQLQAASDLQKRQGGGVSQMGEAYARMLSGAQEGANRYAGAGQQAMMRDQDLRLAAQEKLSAIDRFNVAQRQAGQTERINLEQQLRGQERGYQGAEGQLRAGLTEAGAGALTEANAAIANRKMIEKQQGLQHDRNMELKYGRKPEMSVAPQTTQPSQEQLDLRNAQGEYEAKQKAQNPQYTGRGTIQTTGRAPAMNRPVNKSIAAPGQVSANVNRTIQTATNQMKNRPKNVTGKMDPNDPYGHDY